MKQKIIAAAILSVLLLVGTINAQESHSPLTATVVVTKGEPQGSDYSSLFDGSYEKTNFEFVIGYVNKSWRCSYPSGISTREDFFGYPDQYFHGIQFGGIYTPSFDWGLGLRTGLFFEVYNSYSPWLREYCSGFSEVDMYIPVHASYRVPFTEDMGITFFGGVAFQWAMCGEYYKYRGWGISYRRGWYRDYYTQRQIYGVDGWPNQVNWQAECGASLRIKMITLNFTYSWGLNNHTIINSFDDGQTYETDYHARQDKMQASIAFAF